MQATKIRINDLARELEVKSKVILDILAKVGVAEKKTHSSSIEVEEAEAVKKYYQEHGEPGTTRGGSRAPVVEEFKPKIDLSHISKPGDVLKAITQRAVQPATPARPAAPPPLRQTVPPAAAVPAKSVPPKPAVPAASAAPVAPVEPPKPAPRMITPQSVAAARPPVAVVVPPPKVPIAPPVPPAAVAEKTKPSELTVEDQVPRLAKGPAPSETMATEVAQVIEADVAPFPVDATPATLPVPGPGIPAGRLAPPAPPHGGVHPATGAPGRAAHPTGPPRRLIVPQ